MRPWQVQGIAILTCRAQCLRRRRVDAVAAVNPPRRCGTRSTRPVIL